MVGIASEQRNHILRIRSLKDKAFSPALSLPGRQAFAKHARRCLIFVGTPNKPGTSRCLGQLSSTQTACCVFFVEKDIYAPSSPFLLLFSFLTPGDGVVHLCTIQYNPFTHSYSQCEGCVAAVTAWGDCARRVSGMFCDVRPATPFRTFHIRWCINSCSSSPTPLTPLSDIDTSTSRNPFHHRRPSPSPSAYTNHSPPERSKHAR
ncbi:hypothetical protein BDY17DRAFT_40713 [Neohortaea acidophila]|uniref:Uncharacterized protein n=1 Tax=Neohortaea acidophila TaxID=245834 RepID=A0A6A6PHQ3_9PEZI|nr:uncharacterized protein BDY17DRAFT_40713 [Neohortaea acidophila]KAF2479530.1 hypothetical protein BDY17DRAFT_40713 [Neohortaea acidophila]